MNIKNTLIVGGLHGDEPTGINLCRELSAPGIKTMIGNLEAIKSNARFKETDLNRSFDVKVPISLEEKLAVDIKSEILKSKPNLILDFHNTKSKNMNCAITVMKPNKLHKTIANHFGFNRIIVMPPSGSLISILPDISLSLEISKNTITKNRDIDLHEKVLSIRDIKGRFNDIEVYEFQANVKLETLHRLKLKPQSFVNFLIINDEIKRKLGIPNFGEYYPIFVDNEYPGNIAFVLVKLVT